MNDFPSVFITTLTMSRLVGSLTVALVCGLVIAGIYRLTYRGTSYSPTFSQSLVAFAMITTIVIMVIGNNLARAFGLVGSMSIVRFRMAIKDTRDIVFIFFSLAIGMAAGVGQHLVAFVATGYIGVVIFILTTAGFAAVHRREFLLQFHYTGGGAGEPPYASALASFCRKYKLINVRTIGEADTVELSYYVDLKRADSVQEFIRGIAGVPGVSAVNFFYDEE